MLTGHKLDLCKLHLLHLLDNYAGVEAREQQLVTDMQVTHGPHITPVHVRQALDALADQDHAARRKDPYRGWVWRITPAGHSAAAQIALTEEN